jgi:hypothetical protein
MEYPFGNMLHLFPHRKNKYNTALFRHPQLCNSILARDFLAQRIVLALAFH